MKREHWHLNGKRSKECPEYPPILCIIEVQDALFFGSSERLLRRAGELSDSIHGVQVSDDVMGVFNATPLEKYESYRIFQGRIIEEYKAMAPKEGFRIMDGTLDIELQQKMMREQVIPLLPPAVAALASKELVVS